MAGTYQYSVGYQSWETPKELFLNACQEYNIFPKLDVCATKENTKCPEYFNLRQDGLSKNWSKTFFCNPPYGDDAAWIQKCYLEHMKNGVSGMALIFAKVDTRWWHLYVEGKAEVHNHKGRISFLKGGKKFAPSPRPSCWVIWR